MGHIYCGIITTLQEINVLGESILQLLLLKISATTEKTKYATLTLRQNVLRQHPQKQIGGA